MNKTLDIIIKKYGIETVIARLIEQLRILSESNNDDVTSTVKSFLNETPSDTEYIYNLCEFTHLVTFASNNEKINDSPWEEDEVRKTLIKVWED